MGDRRPFIALLSLALAAPAALAVPAGLAVATAQPAGALVPTIVVDDWADELNADGDCALREAVETLNSGAPVDACALPASPVIEIPGTVGVLSSTLVVSETMTIRGTGALPASISCSAVAAGDCIDNIGAGSDLDLENLWISMAPGNQVYAAPGAGHLHLRDVNVWGGSAGVVGSDSEIRIEHGTVWDTSGWGVFSLTGDVTVDHATLGGHDDGAVYADLADVTVSSSAVYTNEGIGIFGQSGEVEIVSSTIADNGDEASRTHDGTVTFRSSTVIGNARAANVTGPGETRFSNTVVADNDLGNCVGTVESDGFNLADDATCAFDQATDRTGIDPELGAFDNTAISPSAAPLTGSPLIDAGGDCPTVDQLGAVRPADADGDGEATCDIGAVELAGVAGPVVDPTDDPTDPAGPDAGADEPSVPAAAPAQPVSARPTFTG